MNRLCPYGQREGELPPLGKKYPQTAPAVLQDGILLGAVGAYDWNGAVLKETSSGKVIPLRESYLQEFPEELKNHGAYLGKKTERGSPARAEFMILRLIIGRTTYFSNESWQPALPA